MNYSLDELIDEAFGNEVIPTGLLIKGEHLEALQIQKFFAGKKWSEITLKALQNEYVGDGSACLWFMKPSAAAYYLPAYLKMAALTFEEADSISSELMIKLRRAAEGEHSSFAEGLDLLRDEQHAAIAQVLKQVAIKYESAGPVRDASIALNLKWNIFL